MKKLLVLILVATFLPGCASYFKRKECEKTNWFDHGYKRAMSGKRLQGDNFLQECQKVEAQIDHPAVDQGFKAGMGNYCKPEVAYQTGKKGDFFNENMCDVGGVRKLKARHAQGVRDLCQPSQGKAKGATGWKYNNICPKDLEPGFLRTYNVGRKIYLGGVVKSKQSEIVSLDQKISDYNRQKTELSMRLRNLGSVGKTTKRRVVDVGSGKFEESYSSTTPSQESPEQLRLQKDDLERKIRRLNNQIQSSRNKQSQLRKEIATIEAEARAL